MKSTHILHLPFAFFTITTFANHDGYLISSMKPVSFNFVTSSTIAALFSSPTFLFFYEIGLVSGEIESLCVIIVSSIPGISEGCHANKSMFLFKVARIFSLSSSCMAVPRLVVWCAVSPICTCSSSSMGLTLLSWNSSLGLGLKG
jgi:hypothetical protein